MVLRYDVSGLDVRTTGIQRKDKEFAFVVISFPMKWKWI